MGDKTEQLVVEVYVRDLAASEAFYVALGFRRYYASTGFLALEFDDSRLFLDERPEYTAPDSPSANVRVLVPDVDRYWGMAQELGARVWAPIADRPYGLRDFTILDPDGFGIRFASRIPT